MARKKDSEKRQSGNEIVGLHLRIGWWSLLVFVLLGSLLEFFHGWKIGWYLDVSNSTRRLMWTLAHAHGTLLSLVNIAFAWTTSTLVAAPNQLASRCLLGSTLLIPGGFFLGGTTIYAGDPGLGILLLPIGAFLLVVAIVLTARACK